MANEREQSTVTSTNEWLARVQSLQNEQETDDTSKLEQNYLAERKARQERRERARSRSPEKSPAVSKTENAGNVNPEETEYSETKRQLDQVPKSLYRLSGSSDNNNRASNENLRSGDGKSRDLSRTDLLASLRGTPAKNTSNSPSPRPSATGQEHTSATRGPDNTKTNMSSTGSGERSPAIGGPGSALEHPRSPTKVGPGSFVTSALSRSPTQKSSPSAGASSDAADLIKRSSGYFASPLHSNRSSDKAEKEPALEPEKAGRRPQGLNIEGANLEETQSHFTKTDRPLVTPMPVTPTMPDTPGKSGPHTPQARLSPEAKLESPPKPAKPFESAEKGKINARDALSQMKGGLRSSSPERYAPPNEFREGILGARGALKNRKDNVEISSRYSPVSSPKLTPKPERADPASPKSASVSVSRSPAQKPESTEQNRSSIMNASSSPHTAQKASTFPSAKDNSLASRINPNLASLIGRNPMGPAPSSKPVSFSASPKEEKDENAAMLGSAQGNQETSASSLNHVTKSRAKKPQKKPQALQRSASALSAPNKAHVGRTGDNKDTAESSAARSSIPASSSQSQESPRTAGVSSFEAKPAPTSETSVSPKRETFNPLAGLRRVEPGSRPRTYRPFVRKEAGSRPETPEQNEKAESNPESVNQAADEAKQAADVANVGEERPESESTATKGPTGPQPKSQAETEHDGPEADLSSAIPKFGSARFGRLQDKPMLASTSSSNFTSPVLPSFEFETHRSKSEAPKEPSVDPEKRFSPSVQRKPLPQKLSTSDQDEYAPVNVKGAVSKWGTTDSKSTKSAEKESNDTSTLSTATETRKERSWMKHATTSLPKNAFAEIENAGPRNPPQTVSRKQEIPKTDNISVESLRIKENMSPRLQFPPERSSRESTLGQSGQSSRDSSPTRRTGRPRGPREQTTRSRSNSPVKGDRFPRMVPDFLRSLSPKRKGGSFDINAIYESRGEDPHPEKSISYSQSWSIHSGSQRQSCLSREQHYLHIGENRVVLYSFTAHDGSDCNIVFVWQGRESTASSDETDRFVQRLERDYDARRVWIKQGKETGAFLRSLGGIAVIMSSRPGHDEMLFSCRLLYGSIVVDEVPFGCASLCSGFSYVVHTKTGAMVWNGVGSLPAERSAAMTVAVEMTAKSRAQERVIDIAEGQEPDDFWNVLGKGSYPSASYWSYRTQKIPSQPLRAFRIDENIDEIYNVTQDDLSSSHIYVLDAYFEFYVIVGFHARFDRALISRALEFCQEFSQHAVVADERTLDPLCNVIAPPSKVPRDFKAFFRYWNEQKSLTMNSELSSANLGRARSLNVMDIQEAANLMNRRSFTLKEVRSGHLIGFTPENADEWLVDSDFQSVFGMSRAQYSDLPEHERRDIRESSLALMRQLRSS